MTAGAQAGEYLAPWLIRLNEEAPKAAARFFEDPKLATKLDRLLVGINDVEDKYAIVRMALEAGLDPNDALIDLVITCTKIQRVMNADFEGVMTRLRDTIRHADDTVEAIKAFAQQTMDLVAAERKAIQDEIAGERKAVQAEIKGTARLALKAIERGASEITAGNARQREELAAVVSEATATLTAVQKALDDFPKFTAAFQQQTTESTRTLAAAAVNEHAKTYVAGQVELETKGQVAAIITALNGMTNELLAAREHLVPLRKAAERAKADERVLVFGHALRNREYVAFWAGASLSGVLCSLAMLAVINVFHLGMDRQAYIDIRAGRIYQAMYPLLNADCRTDINTLLAGRGQLPNPDR